MVQSKQSFLHVLAAEGKTDLARAAEIVALEFGLPLVVLEAFNKVTEADVSDAPVVKFVNGILLQAIQKGASDIHFESSSHLRTVATLML